MADSGGAHREGESLTNVTFLNGGTISFYPPLELFKDTDAGREHHEVSLFDLLALLAAGDARADGRDADAATAAGLVPVMDGGQYLTITEEQGAEVLRHVGEPKPLIVRTGKNITDAMGASTRHRMWFDGTSYFTDAGTSGSLAIRSTDGEKVLVSAGTNKLFTHFGGIVLRDGIASGPNEVTRVTTSYAEVLQARGLADTKKNRRRIREELEALKRMAFRWTDKKGTEHDVPLQGGDVAVKRDGTITFTFSPDFMALVMGHNAGLLPVDRLLMTTDDWRHPHAFAIGYRLTVNAYMNRNKPNRWRLSVAKLLDYVKSIPSYEDVAAGDRAFTRRMIEPLEHDLDYLYELGVLDFWDYCHTNGESLTDEEQDKRLDADGNDAPLPYDIAKDCLIEWRPTHGYEGHMQAVEAARNRNREAAAAERAARDREEQAMQRRIRNKRADYVAKGLAKSDLEDMAEGQKVTSSTAEGA